MPNGRLGALWTNCFRLKKERRYSVGGSVVGVVINGKYAGGKNKIWEKTEI